MIVDEIRAHGTQWNQAQTLASCISKNTMRDALIAGITLNIFNKHSDRVKMANLAQIVNVLQSVILTDGADMITDTNLSCI